MSKLATMLTITLATVIGVAGTAAADGDASSEKQVRSGLMLGFGAGVGHIACSSADDTCEDATGAGGLSFHIGGMLGPRFAINLDSWAMVHVEDDLTLSQTIATIAGQYWVAPRLWIKGGVGVASARLTIKFLGLETVTETETVPGVMGAIGYEVITGREFALDIQLRGGTGFYDDDRVRAHNVSLGAGLTWF